MMHDTISLYWYETCFSIVCGRSIKFYIQQDLTEQKKMFILKNIYRPKQRKLRRVRNLNKCLIKEKKVIFNSYFFLLLEMKFIYLSCLKILELQNFKTRRVAAFKKNLIDLTDFEIKHAKVTILYYWKNIFLVFVISRFNFLFQAHAEMLKKCLSALQNEWWLKCYLLIIKATLINEKK